MKRSTKRIIRVLIGILYIIWGIASPVSAYEALIALDTTALVSAGIGVLMLLAGILALFHIRKSVCRVFGIVIFLANAVPIALALPTIHLQSVTSAVLALLFVICV